MKNHGMVRKSTLLSTNWETGMSSSFTAEVGSDRKANGHAHPPSPNIWCIYICHSRWVFGHHLPGERAVPHPAGITGVHWGPQSSGGMGDSFPGPVVPRDPTAWDSQGDAYPWISCEEPPVLPQEPPSLLMATKLTRKLIPYFKMYSFRSGFLSSKKRQHPEVCSNTLREVIQFPIFSCQ